jgi:hypothetical protein
MKRFNVRPFLLSQFLDYLSSDSRILPPSLHRIVRKSRLEKLVPRKCLAVAIQPFRVQELVKILTVDTGGIKPKLNVG